MRLRPLSGALLACCLAASTAGARDPFPKMHKPFVAGYRSFQKGNWLEALRSLEPLQEVQVPFRDYILSVLGTSRLQLNQCAEAHQSFTELTNYFPQSRWMGDAEKGKIESLLCLGDHETARRRLEVFLRGDISRGDRGWALFRRAGLGSLEELKGFALAFPDDPSFGEAVVRLSATGQWGEEAKREAARRLAILGLCDRAVEMGADPSDVAGCLFRARRYREASEATEGFCEQDPSAPCLRSLSQAAARSGRSELVESAVRANERLLELFPQSDEAGEARLRIATLKLDARRYADAVPALTELLEGSSGEEGRREEPARRLAWALIQLKEYEEADRHLGNDPLAETPWGRFWRGTLLERMGRKAEAKGLFGLILQLIPGGSNFSPPDPRSLARAKPDARSEKKTEDLYYALRALEKREGDRASFFRAWLGGGRLKPRWDSRNEVLEPEEALDRLFELNAMGLEADAEYELRRLRAASIGRLSLPLNQGALKRRGDRYVWKRKILREEHPDYPLPHADILFPLAEESHIDPLLLYAMMRQESRYRTTAVSPAGALGLLQVMPETGERMASHLGWAGFEIEWLHEPGVNLSLAMATVRRLFKRFPQDWIAVAAAFNAGEGVVAGWLKERGDLSALEFIEEIPYTETREYVKRVYVNYAAYRYLYSR